MSITSSSSSLFELSPSTIALLVRTNNSLLMFADVNLFRILLCIHAIVLNERSLAVLDSTNAINLPDIKSYFAKNQYTHMRLTEASATACHLFRKIV